MSVLCLETNKSIRHGSILLGATRRDIDTFYALSDEAISGIPHSERRYRPCTNFSGANSGGLDIHGATSTKGVDGNYTLMHMRIGRFLFSISKESAEKYLPKTYTACTTQVAKTAST